MESYLSSYRYHRKCKVKLCRNRNNLETLVDNILLCVSFALKKSGPTDLMYFKDLSERYMKKTSSQNKKMYIFNGIRSLGKKMSKEKAKY